MTNIGPRDPEAGTDWDGHLPKETREAVLISRALNALKEMEQVEGLAYTEDAYTARIPGAMLKSWRIILNKVLFRLRSEIDL